jgi:hypothetical protein
MKQTLFSGYVVQVLHKPANLGLVDVTTITGTKYLLITKL